jgi:hypothetical protein
MTLLSTLRGIPRRIGRRILLAGLHYVQARPVRRAQLARLLRRFPWLETHLKGFARMRYRGGGVTDGGLIEVTAPPPPPPAALDYPLAARRIFQHFQQARR